MQRHKRTAPNTKFLIFTGIVHKNYNSGTLYLRVTGHTTRVHWKVLEDVHWKQREGFGLNFAGRLFSVMRFCVARRILLEILMFEFEILNTSWNLDLSQFKRF